MNDQTSQDWKAEAIAEYARLEKEIALETHGMDTDPELNKLGKERTILNKKFEEIEAGYRENIRAAQQQQAGIKLELVDNWYGEEKTFECSAGTATLRTTKSLKIQSKQKLIDFLVLNKKLVDYIKTFEIAKLRKIKDAGFLGDEVVSYDETKSIAIKIAEEDQ